jgi:hypothetical protein
MISRIDDEVILAARVLLATVFLIFGWRKLRDFSGTVSQMVQLGVPVPVLAAAAATSTACLLLDDARLVARSGEWAGTSCFRLSTSLFLIDQVEFGFVCLHQSKRRCLWVPSRAVGPMSFDDGVF